MQPDNEAGAHVFYRSFCIITDMTDPIYIFPIWIIAVDCVLGLVLLTLVGRTGMNFSPPENSPFFCMKIFAQAANLLSRVFRPITSGFLIQPLGRFMWGGSFLCSGFK
jgi:hypothetical protein